MSEGRDLWDAVIVGEVERDCLWRSIPDGAAGSTRDTTWPSGNRSSRIIWDFRTGRIERPVAVGSRQGTGPSIRRSRPAEMIIAVGRGATAGQVIDRDLFDESLQCHRLLRIGTNEAWVAGASSEMEGWR